MRECSKCHEVKDGSDFYRRTSGALHAQCKECTRREARARTDARRAEAGRPRLDRAAIRVDDAGRDCTGCRVYKPWTEYYPHPRGLRGHFARCKQCQGVGLRVPTDYDEHGRQCTSCRTYKTWDAFGPRPNGRNGRQATCRTCDLERAAKYRRAAGRPERTLRPDDERYYHSRFRESELFARMAAEQRHRCAICWRKPDRLVADHDHATGLVRALLCDRCNTGLHMVEDEGLHRCAVEYLDRWRR